MTLRKLSDDEKQEIKDLDFSHEDKSDKTS
jgi:hypothetical protein